MPTPTHLVDFGSTTDGTSYTTTSITPSANKLILASFMAASAVNVPTIVVTGCGLTWELVFQTPVGTRTLSVFRAMGTPTAGTVTFSAGTVTLTSGIWSITEFGGVDTSGTNGSGAIGAASLQARPASGTSVSQAFASTPAASSAVYAAIGITGVNETMNAGAGWTKLAGGGIGSPAMSMMSEWAASAPANILANWTTSSAIYVVGVEVKAAPVAPPSINKLKLAASAVANLKFGLSTITKAYLGSTAVWDVADPLAVWKAAYAAQATSPASILAIGDSFTEGQGASTLPARWTTQAKDQLTAAGRGAEYFASWYATYGPDSPWGNNATWTASSGTLNHQNWPSLGMRLLEMATAGSSVTFTVTGASADLWLFSGGVFTYQVDGGTITSTGTIAGTSQLTRFPISLGADGSHTVKIVSTNTFGYYAGMTVYRGSPNGVQLFGAAHTAFTTADFTTALSTADYNSNIAYWGYTAPDLVSFCLAGNDYLNNIAAATAAANLSTLIDSAKGLTSTPSILVIIPHNLTGHEAAGRTWADYRTQLYSVANTKGAAILDLSAVLNPATHFRSDGLHYNDLGHDAVTTAFINAIAA